MEKSLEKHMMNTLNNQGVTGIMCVDQRGLCLGAKGNAAEKNAGSVSAIAAEAEKILSDNTTPIVCLETTSTNILIKSHEGYTTAIYKNPS